MHAQITLKERYAINVMRKHRYSIRAIARITAETWEIVDRYLRMDWSPEQVSGFLRAEGILGISHEAIYIHVWADKRAGDDLWKHLRQSGKRYRSRDWRWEMSTEETAS